MATKISTRKKNLINHSSFKFIELSFAKMHLKVHSLQVTSYKCIIYLNDITGWLLMNVIINNIKMFSFVSQKERRKNK